MKILFSILIAVFIFSGCSTKHQNYRLLKQNQKQALIIKKQKHQIQKLRSKLFRYKNMKHNTLPVRNTNHSYNKQKTGIIPKKPIKTIKLKKVEDKNYSSGYMYPKTKVPTLAKAENHTNKAIATNTMTKAKCISMIGQEKFDKYTRMFGSESASLKRCTILSAMK